MTAAVTLSKGWMNIYGAQGLNVGNVGQLAGNLSTSLSQTADNKETVFNLVQDNQAGYANLNMAANDKNIAFYGHNFNASFANESYNGYNVELNTQNSVFDFSNTRSGAMVTTSETSQGNLVALGGGGSYLTSGEIENLDGSKATVGFHNQVMDSGYSNVFIAAAADSNNLFTATTSSWGAYMQGSAAGTDKFAIEGLNGVFWGVGGYNEFTTKAAETLDDDGAHHNVTFGGVGYNIYNDFGMHNMYQGAYATLADGAKQSGYDTLRMNGYYGVARLDATALPEGFDQSLYFNGSYNTVFTADEQTFTDKKSGESRTINYYDYLNGTYSTYQRSNGRNWTLSDFYGAAESGVGYSRAYGYSLLERVLNP